MKVLLSLFALLFTVQAHAQTWYPSELGDFEVKVETSELKSGRAAAEQNTIKLTFRSTDGSAIEQVELSPSTVTPFMPSMGHGTATIHNVTLDFMGQADVVFVDNVYFVMPNMGHHGWVLRLNPVINSLTTSFEVPVNVGG